MVKNSEYQSMAAMKSNIAQAGNLFYQYRSCNKDAGTIHDIENIRHGIVFARTPLRMNDPFDSKVGFSTEEVYEECIDLALNQINPPLDDSIRLIIKSLLKNRLAGKALSFVTALNQLKKYIFRQSKIAHVPPIHIASFVSRDIDRLYGKCPPEIKAHFNKQVFLILAMFVKDYQNVDIDEKTVVSAFQIEESLDQLEKTVEQIKNETYLPFLYDFLTKLTVSCFSASGWDNQLMWSHYANSYSGICVEYDFEKMDEFIGFMYPVKYSTVRPTISLKDLGFKEFKKSEDGNWISEEVNIDSIFSYLLAKNKCWEYEEEWRIINIEKEPYTPTFIKAPFVKSITLGLNLDEICKQLLWDVCKEREIECYQLVVNASDYSLTRELLTEEDFLFDKEKEERYITFISEHAVPLGEKIATNGNTLTAAMESGDFDTASMINLLIFTLDYLSDVYFLKRSFNRLCSHTNVDEPAITEDSEIRIAITQINEFITQLEDVVNNIDGSLVGLRITGTLTPSELKTSQELCYNIKELFNKHRELKWHGEGAD